MTFAIRMIASAALASFSLAGVGPALPAPAAPTALASPVTRGVGAAPAQYKQRDQRSQRDHDQYRDRDRYRYEYDRNERWKTRRSPRRSEWKGRRLPPAAHYHVITRYWDYGLPPPPRGYFYVRSDRDVFLVLETTRTIIDAFILLELLGR